MVQGEDAKGRPVLADTHHKGLAGPDPFSTGHLLPGLKRHALSSGVITLFTQGVQFALNLGSIIILAGLLTPQDFGLVAMVGTVMGFLRIFNEAGLSTATVQKENITHAQVSNLFWTNLSLGAGITLLMVICSPAVAWFYRDDRLTGITLVLCMTFLLSGMSVQHMALLKRQMRFKMIAVIQIGGALIGLVVGAGMALMEYGYWSLVGMNLATVITTLVLTLAVSRWLPQLPTRGSGTRSLLNFGASLTASSFLWSLARGTDALLIGRIHGAASLGFYSRAQVLLLRPVEQFIAPLEAVVIPTLSRLQTDPASYRNIVFKMLEMVALASFVGGGLLLALAYPLTIVVLGEQWGESAPIFAGFTLVALYSPLASVAGWLLTSQGRGKDFLKISCISSLSAVASYGVGIPFGPVGVAFSYSLSCLLVQLPAAYYIAGRKGPVLTAELWSHFFRQIPIWGVVFGATWFIRQWVADEHPWIQLFVCGSTGIIAGAGFVFIYAPARRVIVGGFELMQEWRKPREQSDA